MITAIIIYNKGIFIMINTNSTTFKNGYISDYHDLSVWIENVKEHGKAIIIKKDKNTTFTLQNATIEKIVVKSEYEDEKDYDNICMLMLGKHDITGEFVTDKDIFYVGLSINNEPFMCTKEITYDNVYYC